MVKIKRAADRAARSLQARPAVEWFTGLLSSERECSHFADDAVPALREYPLSYAGHSGKDNDATTTTYVRATVHEVAAALAALTGEAHPLST